MNLFTHLELSLRLKRVIERNLDIRLRTIPFILGNIKPDFVAPYTNMPHYKKDSEKKDSEQFVREEILAILDSKIYESEKCPPQFSERLGVITHYLSDFFCHAHSESFPDKFLKHYLYEMQLSLYCLSHTKGITLRGEERPIAIQPNPYSIYNYIEELHAEYHLVSPNVHHVADMTFALKACASMCLSVLSICLANEESFFAVQEEEALA